MTVNDIPICNQYEDEPILPLIESSPGFWMSVVGTLLRRSGRTEVSASCLDKNNICMPPLFLSAMHLVVASRAHTGSKKF